MPRHHEVPSLTNLCLKGIGSLVVYVGKCHIFVSRNQIYNGYPKTIWSLQESLDWLNKHLVSHIPWNLYDAMAVEVLTSVKGLIEETQKIYPHPSTAAISTEMNIVIRLPEVVIGSKLKQINLSQWPEIISRVLFKNLQNMTGLENLTMPSCSVRICEYDKYLLNGIMAMRNLKSLCHSVDSTDEFVQLVGENCPNLQTLDLTDSWSVTDRSIPFLLKLKNLRELQLHQTWISIEGLAQLIIHLPKLENIGRWDGFGNVINYLHENHHSYGPFSLKKIHPHPLSTTNLKLFVKMFPKAEFISLVQDEWISDPTVLISLDNLRALKLSEFRGNYLKELLEAKGNNIIHLFLKHVRQMDVKVVTDISKYCPQLKSLLFTDCDFINSISFPSRSIKSHPFLNLEIIFWNVDGAISYLEFILMCSPNIRHIHIYYATDLTHSTIVKVLNVNPMRELIEFSVHDNTNLHKETALLLLNSCPNIKLISTLWAWEGITFEEVIAFEHYISSNNLDLNIISAGRSFPYPE